MFTKEELAYAIRGHAMKDRIDTERVRTLLLEYDQLDSTSSKEDPGPLVVESWGKSKQIPNIRALRNNLRWLTLRDAKEMSERAAPFSIPGSEDLQVRDALRRDLQANGVFVR